MKFAFFLFLMTLLPEAFAQRVQKASCTDIDVREVNPAIKNNSRLKAHFQTPRNQDSIGWCYAFTSADLMSVKLGVPVSGMHISTIYNNHILNTPSLQKETDEDRNRNPQNFAFTDVYESGRVQDAIKETVSKGRICTEKGLPFDETHPNQVHDLVKALEELKPQVILSNMDRATICREISSIVTPFVVSGQNMTAIADSFVKDNLNKTMTLFADNACKEWVNNIPDMEVKVVRKSTDLEAFMKEVNFNIVKGRLQTVDYDVKPFTGSEGFHSSIILGRRWNNGRCEYNIRNSWGKSCASYVAGTDCNREQGTFWVSDEQLFQASDNIRYIPK